MRDKGDSWKYGDEWICEDVIIRNGERCRIGKLNRDSIEKETVPFLYIVSNRILKYNLVVHVKCSYIVVSRSRYGNKCSRIEFWLKKFSSWLSFLPVPNLYEASTSSSFCFFWLLNNTTVYYHCLLPASCSSLKIMSSTSSSFCFLWLLDNTTVYYHCLLPASCSSLKIMSSSSSSFTESLFFLRFLPASWSVSPSRSLSEYAPLTNVVGGAIHLEINRNLWIPSGSLLHLFLWDWGVMEISRGKRMYNHWKKWNYIGGLMSWGGFRKINSVRKCRSIEKNRTGVESGVEIYELELKNKPVGNKKWTVERILHDNVCKKEGGKGWVVSPRLKKIREIIKNKRVHFIETQKEEVSGKVERLAMRVASRKDLIGESKVMETRARIEIYVGLLSWFRNRIDIYLSFRRRYKARSRVKCTKNKKRNYKYADKNLSRNDWNSVAVVQKGNKSKGAGSSGEEVGGRVKIMNIKKLEDTRGYYINGRMSNVGEGLGYYVLEGLHSKGKKIRLEYILRGKHISIRGSVGMSEVTKKRTQTEKGEQVMYIKNRRKRHKQKRLIGLMYIYNREGRYNKEMQIVNVSRNLDKHDKCSRIFRIEKAKRAQMNKSRKYEVRDIDNIYQIIGTDRLLGKKHSINQESLVILVENRKTIKEVKIQCNRRQDEYLQYTNKRLKIRDRIKKRHKDIRIGNRLTRYSECMEIVKGEKNSVIIGHNKDEKLQCLGNSEIRAYLMKINYKNLVGTKMSVKMEAYQGKEKNLWINSTRQRRNRRKTHAHIMHHRMLITLTWCLARKMVYWVMENIQFKLSIKRKARYSIIQIYQKEINNNWGWKGGFTNKYNIKTKVCKGQRNIIKVGNGKYDRMRWTLIRNEGLENEKDKGGIDMIFKNNHAVRRCKLNKGNGIMTAGKGSYIKVNRQMKGSRKMRDWNSWLKVIIGHKKDVKLQCLGNFEIRAYLMKINYENLVGTKMSVKMEANQGKEKNLWINRTRRRRNRRKTHAHIMHHRVLITLTWCSARKVEYWVMENIQFKQSRKRKAWYLIIQIYQEEINNNWGWKGGFTNKYNIKSKVCKGQRNITKVGNGKYDRMRWTLIQNEGLEDEKDKGGIDMIFKNNHAVRRCKLIKKNGIMTAGKGSYIKVNRQTKGSRKMRDWNSWLKSKRMTGKERIRRNKITLKKIHWNKSRPIKQAETRDGRDLKHSSSHKYLMLLIKKKETLEKGRSSIYWSWVKNPLHPMHLGWDGTSCENIRRRTEENDILEKGKITKFLSLVKNSSYSGRMKERYLGCYGCRNINTASEYGKGKKYVMKIIIMNGNSYRELKRKRIICCRKIEKATLHLSSKINCEWTWTYARVILGEITGNKYASEGYSIGAEKIILQMPRWNKHRIPSVIWTKECKDKNYTTVYNGCLVYYDWKILAYFITEPNRIKRGIIGLILKDLKKRMISEKDYLIYITKVEQESTLKKYKVDGIRREEKWLGKGENKTRFQFSKHNAFRFHGKSVEKSHNHKLGVWLICRGYIFPHIKSKNIRDLYPYKWIGINILGSYNKKIENG